MSGKSGRPVNRRWIAGFGAVVLALSIFRAASLPAQTETAPSQSSETPTPYKPQFAGDPARSDSEAQALGYMRVVLRAENLYKKRHGKYAESLQALAGTGSFTKRMAATTDRGDYTASFKPHRPHDPAQENGFVLTLTPKHMDSDHRSFYAEEDGAIHADDQKPADLESPKIR
jgi:hypothetical protein